MAMRKYCLNSLLTLLKVPSRDEIIFHILWPVQRAIVVTHDLCVV